MNYPSLEQYTEALQLSHLTLSDPELKQGRVATTGLGLPLALCGGFALTYTITNGANKYAIRCFHKHSNALEKRYSSISNRLKSVHSSYFVDFEFQPQGVRVAGQLFPLVKMAWASGVTLGEFLEKNYGNPSSLQNLLTSLQDLAKYLENQRMAHGDIQPGNVMVSDAGKKLQLIDYDGMFVEDLSSLGSSELGHRNFQHPKRASSSWDGTLDRFSFISLDLAVRGLISNPNLWSKTRSDGDSILFKANDFANPGQSVIFNELIGQHNCSEYAKNFASICSSAFSKTPTLEDFLLKKNIPSISILFNNVSSQILSQYLSAFPVLDATSYSSCYGFIGDKVELIGKILEVKQANTYHGKPYTFINFGVWTGNIVKISIWSEGLSALTKKPDASWVGKWISVVGLMEPPYVSTKYKYSHLSISITQSSQLHIIDEKEATYRLAGSSTRSVGSNSKTCNQELLDNIKGGGKSKKNTRQVDPSVKKISGSARTASTSMPSNIDIIGEMKNIQQRSPSPNEVRPVGPYQGAPRTKPSSSDSNCFIATAIYGLDAWETNALRSWRDTYLLHSPSGRFLVATYCRISPLMVPLLKRSVLLNKVIKLFLDKLVCNIVSKNKI